MKKYFKIIFIVFLIKCPPGSNDMFPYHLISMTSHVTDVEIHHWMILYNFFSLVVH